MPTPDIATLSESEFERCMLRAGIPMRLSDRFDQDARDNLEAYVTSSADNTLASFRTHAARWTAWCEENAVDPLSPSPRAVRDFIRAFERGRKPNTIKGMVANIGVLVDGIAGNANVTRTKVVKAEMKRIRREKGCAQRQALAIRVKGSVMDMEEPSLPFSIEQMIGALEPIKTLSSVRARFVMSIGGDTGRADVRSIGRPTSAISTSSRKATACSSSVDRRRIRTAKALSNTPAGGPCACSMSGAKPAARPVSNSPLNHRC